MTLLIFKLRYMYSLKFKMIFLNRIFSELIAYQIILVYIGG